MGSALSMMTKVTPSMKDSIKIIKDKDGDEQPTMRANLKKMHVTDGVGLQLLIRCMKDIF